MIAFPIGLVNPAAEAGMPVPEDIENYDTSDVRYVRWTIFTRMQLGAAMPSPDSHFENAKVIMRVPLDRLKTITPQMLVEEFGFALGYNLS